MKAPKLNCGRGLGEWSNGPLSARPGARCLCGAKPIAEECRKDEHPAYKARRRAMQAKP